MRIRARRNLAVKFVGLFIVGLFTLLGVAGCAPVAPSGDAISESDLQSCDQFSILSNPYDGTNESLWDFDSMDIYKSDVEYAYQYAEETDLQYYFEVLIDAIDEVTWRQGDDIGKSELESLMVDIENAEIDLANQCDVIVNT